MGARGPAGLARLAPLLVALVFPAGAVAGQAWQGDRQIPGCGICYPGGYDINTVGSIRGTLTGAEYPDEGPVRILMEREGEHWVVLASPVRHWRTLGLTIRPGSLVTVRGSKALGSDGTLYLLAQQISPESGAGAVLLRDSEGMPLWRGDSSRGEGGANRGSGQGRWRGNGACRP